MTQNFATKENAFEEAVSKEEFLKKLKERIFVALIYSMVLKQVFLDWLFVSLKYL